MKTLIKSIGFPLHVDSLPQFALLYSIAPFAIQVNSVSRNILFRQRKFVEVLHPITNNSISELFLKVFDNKAYPMGQMYFRPCINPSVNPLIDTVTCGIRWAVASPVPAKSLACPSLLRVSLNSAFPKGNNK